VKSLAGLHGGTVSLDSAPGRGTRVMVLLPLGERADAELEQPLYKSSRAG
jgi:signal transduction histidine kinase